jgi:hypothetical protein
LKAKPLIAVKKVVRKPKQAKSKKPTKKPMSASRVIPEVRDWNKQINPLFAYAGDSTDSERQSKSIKGNFSGIQGAGNEQLVAARLLKHGFVVLFKLWGDTKYDMVIDCEGHLFRAQVKGTTRKQVKFCTRLRGGEAKEHVKPVKFYTRNDCDLVIGVDSENGDCYVVPVDYSVALRKEIVHFKHLQNFKERWDFISGNDYLSSEEIIRGIGRGELQNKLREILPVGTAIPSDDNELILMFYESCPPPQQGKQP